MPRISKEIVIKNVQGLHARPAAIFVQIATKHNVEVTIQKDDAKVNGKSIMGILTLGAQQNAVVVLEVDGDDAEKVLFELEELLTKEKFDE